MPVTRKRKTVGAVGKRPRKKSPPLVAFGPKGLSVSPRAFNQLRDKPDFEVLVRIGRIVNALGFALETQKHTPDLPRPEQIRMSTRGMFLMSAYLWEALKVIDRLIKADRDTYKDLPSFSRLAAVADPKSYGKHKAVLENIRNKVGFHLDHENEVTKGPLARMEQVEDYDILSMNAERRFFYLGISDEIDIIHMVEKFRARGQSKRQTLVELIELVTMLAVEVMVGANQFVIDLLVRLELIPDASAIMLAQTLPSQADETISR